jgi:hypothetical protein
MQGVEQGAASQEMQVSSGGDELDGVPANGRRRPGRRRTGGRGRGWRRRTGGRCRGGREQDGVPASVYMADLDGGTAATERI